MIDTSLSVSQWYLENFSLSFLFYHIYVFTSLL